MLTVLLLALAPQSNLAPLDFLVGHCWQHANGPVAETQCFTAEGDTVHDRREVTLRGEIIERGDIVFSWDAVAKAIRYVDTSPAGTMRGIVRPVRGGLDLGIAAFDGAPPVTDPTFQLRTSWMRVGETELDMFDQGLANPNPATPARYTRSD